MTAARSRAKRFRLLVQHEGQTPVRQAFVSADTAIGHAREAVEHGATTATVTRAGDEVLICDAVTGFELPVTEWN